MPVRGRKNFIKKITVLGIIWKFIHWELDVFITESETIMTLGSVTTMLRYLHSNNNFIDKSM